MARGDSTFGRGFASERAATPLLLNSTIRKLTLLIQVILVLSHHFPFPRRILESRGKMLLEKLGSTF